ncbi:uncharacterized protein A4U43_C05F32610 [Asparagus officinalis]|uniref:Phosphatidylinositol-specific phospholipase C X domain-containing protein n=1 Tax=Asparagus officinalis TaxID=4686 RepID=A0A5P1F0K5_ASPOF|nr:PI-PLC X domain-containing protein At5g67130 [Asparagus officinalis]ONK70329.1 uncharacterized protein A4U43_C05F32610 [Asparagus officinalis]
MRNYQFTPILLLSLLLVPSPAAACSSGACQLLDSCSRADDCSAGLYCGKCAAAGKKQPICVRGQANQPASIVKDLPFNKYTWIMTHNSFSIDGEPSSTGVPRVTFYNQEDTVTNQLRNGVRGLMLDMYDFEGDVWLCHSFQGQCYNFTAFEPAINTLKEVEAFLSQNPLEIVTIIIEDYVHAPKGLTKLFTNSGLTTYWYPVTAMPANGKDWPSVSDMVARNHRLLVFTNIASKEADEGIAYQWRYMVENEPGDPGLVPGSCPNRKESPPLNSKSSSLFLMNYFPTFPVQNEACKEHSGALGEMVNACYKASGNVVPNFLAVNFYMRSDGGGIFDIQDRINGLNLCGCKTIAACQVGAPFGVCKNIGSSNSNPPPSINNRGGIISGTIELSGSASTTVHTSDPLLVKLLLTLTITALLL